MPEIFRHLISCPIIIPFSCRVLFLSSTRKVTLLSGDSLFALLISQNSRMRYLGYYLVAVAVSLFIDISGLLFGVTVC